MHIQEAALPLEDDLANIVDRYRENWKPLELIAEIRDVAIFAKTKYKQCTNILKSLKFVSSIFCKINITGICVICVI